MRDAISIKRIDTLHPALRQEVRETIEEVEKDLPAGISVRVTDGLRTFHQQAQLYAKGRTEPGPKRTRAQAGSSYHNYGLAWDGVILVNGKPDYKHASWKKVVEAFKKKGWFWGGDFKTFFDGPHLEKTFGFTVKQLLARYKDKNFLPVTEYVNLDH
jgi:peptidoglycan L-alanyl-D-glutamate endopeptidase CwlK